MAAESDIAIVITARDEASPVVQEAGARIQAQARMIGRSMAGIGVATMGTISIIRQINPALAETLKPLEIMARIMTVIGALMMFLSSVAGVKLIATLRGITGALWANASAALAAAGNYAALAAAKIWAWAGGIPFIGIGLAIAGVAALGASVWAIHRKFAAMAEGGIVTRPTLALIGERGPEAVVPLRGGRAGGTSVIVNVGTWLGDREGVERLTDRIMESLRSRQRLAMGKAQF